MGDTTSTLADKVKKGEDKMVKKGEMATKNLDKERILQLERDNIALREQADIAQHSMSDASAGLGRVASEMRKIRLKGRSSANTITVVEKHDHKNISLWTRAGKRIGPLHPENAIQTLNRFADLGVVLTADQPTSAQIEAYKKTREYEISRSKEADRRTRKEKSRKGKALDKLVELMAKQYGLKEKDLRGVLRPDQVGKK